jgi:UDP-N-acetylmuramoyl-tripeptide--D-alanyl-D-alanine ligase
MRLALDSFIESAASPRGVILGDMLELGEYVKAEHEKILTYLLDKEINVIVLVGPHFKDAIEGVLKSENKKIQEKIHTKIQWFPTVQEAKQWLGTVSLAGFTFLLKGSRGVAIEKVL